MQSIICMRYFFFILAILTIGSLKAQSPLLIPYQSVARNAAGHVLENAPITVRFTLHNLTVDGSLVWTELHALNTNSTGLFSVQLGSVVSLAIINWAHGDKFLQVECDFGSGFLDLGTQQLLSVPYALHAGSVSLNVSYQGDTLFVGQNDFVIVPGISEANQFTTGSALHTCDAAQIHNPALTYGSMIDRDGRRYKTIVIGTQEWMAENLNVSTYRNGDEILTGLADTVWQTTTEGAWAYYNDDASKACPFGKLYNWYTTVDPRGVCPVGWHVPTDDDWSALVGFLGSFYVIGVKMKSTGTIEDATGLWRSPNQNASNSSGFSGLPGGLRYGDGHWGAMDGYGYYWSSTIDADEPGTAWYRYLSFNNFILYRHYSVKRTGFSIRCVKD